MRERHERVVENYEKEVRETEARTGKKGRNNGRNGISSVPRSYIIPWRILIYPIMIPPWWMIFLERRRLSLTADEKGRGGRQKAVRYLLILIAKVNIRVGWHDRQVSEAQNLQSCSKIWRIRESGGEMGFSYRITRCHLVDRYASPRRD